MKICPDESAYSKGLQCDMRCRPAACGKIGPYRASGKVFTCQYDALIPHIAKRGLDAFPLRVLAQGAIAARAAARSFSQAPAWPARSAFRARVSAASARFVPALSCSLCSAAAMDAGVG